jgi:formate-dependent nitrite reductase membrane component NrfD
MVGDSFRLGYRFQRHWGTSMASAFFCGEVGAGLFLVSMIFESLPGLVLGWLLVAIGKPLFHLTHMGVPAKSWRAILRPDRSWTSRGLIAIVVFAGAGGIHTLDAISGGAIPLGIVFQFLAGAAALVVMTYQGFAMSHSTAIALWNTAMMPFSSLLYGLTAGVVVTLALGAGELLYTALGLLAALGIMLLSLLHAAYHGSPGGRLSAELLIKTLYAKWFHGVVVAAGILLPMASLWLGNETLAAAGILAGFFAFRVLIFKAGVYEPIMSFGTHGT